MTSVFDNEPSPGAMAPSGSRDLAARLLALYAEADAAVAAAGPRCESSGRCCRFAEYGHTLFLSQMEADLLIANAPLDRRPIVSGRCPYQDGNLCTAREPRPLGCRVYFCEPSYQTRMQEIMEEFNRRLKSLADEFAQPWRYAPLHTFLAEATMEPAPTEKRTSLPLVS